MAEHDHPLFTQLYRVLARVGERGEVGRARRRAARDLWGRLLIVGLGPGHDLDHLPHAVSEVVALEPSPSMRRAAAAQVEAFERGGRSIEVVDALAEDLPLADDSIDSILFAYVLCTVTDPDRALAEARRVLRPGGAIGVLEHVRARRGSLHLLPQLLLAPLWPAVGGGCHCDRETRAAFERAGFDMSQVADTTLVNLPPVAPAIVGTARIPEVV